MSLFFIIIAFALVTAKLWIVNINKIKNSHFDCYMGYLMYFAMFILYKSAKTFRFQLSQTDTDTRAVSCSEQQAAPDCHQTHMDSFTEIICLLLL